METWILMVTLLTYDTSGQRQDGAPTPIVWDYGSRAECEAAAIEFIGGDESRRKQSAWSFERFGTDGDGRRTYRCIRGPRR